MCASGGRHKNRKPPKHARVDDASARVRTHPQRVVGAAEIAQLRVAAHSTNTIIMQTREHAQDAKQGKDAEIEVGEGLVVGVVLEVEQLFDGVLGGREDERGQLVVPLRPVLVVVVIVVVGRKLRRKTKSRTTSKQKAAHEHAHEYGHQHTQQQRRQQRQQQQ